MKPAAKRTIAMMTKGTGKRRQSKVFDLEKVCAPSKRLKGLLSSKQKSTTCSSNKKLQSVTWSATVPENKVAERTILRKGTPPRPKRSSSAAWEGTPTNSSTERARDASIPSSITILNSEIPDSTGAPLGCDQGRVDAAECRAAAIESSQLTVRMARSRAVQAETSLEVARRHEKQAMNALLEASNDRIQAEKDHEDAKYDMKEAGEYLTELLKSSNIAKDDRHNSTDDNEESKMPFPKEIYVPVAEEHPTATKFKDVTNSIAGVDTSPVITVSKGTSPAKVAREEEPVIKEAKDKRMMCTYSKRMGSYTGQGRRDNETGAFERHGEGYMIISDSVFTGDFVANKRQGQGSDLNSRGYGYTGEWKDDRKHGFGSTKDAAGLSEGRWEHDNRVGPHTYWFHDGKMCLKNHINNRDLCGPSLTFSSNCGTVKSFEDGVLEVVKPEMVAFYVEQMGASIPSPRKLF